MYNVELYMHYQKQTIDAPEFFLMTLVIIVLVCFSFNTQKVIKNA